MVNEIHIADSQQRNSRVNLMRRIRQLKFTYVDQNGRPVEAVRVVKGSPECDRRLEAMDPDEMAQALIDGDPEIDLELFGKRVHETVRIYLNEDNDPAMGVTIREEVYKPDGQLKDERPYVPNEANVNNSEPLQWGRLMPKQRAYNKFVFSHAYQLTHVNGLTYDFLYKIAKELDEADSLMLLGAGPKGNQPLAVQRGGTSYRGFLEGRVQEDRYLLVLHLTNLELKAYKPDAE